MSITQMHMRTFDIIMIDNRMGGVNSGASEFTLFLYHAKMKDDFLNLHKRFLTSKSQRRRRGYKGRHVLK